MESDKAKECAHTIYDALYNVYRFQFFQKKVMNIAEINSFLTYVPTNIDTTLFNYLSKISLNQKVQNGLQINCTHPTSQSARKAKQQIIHAIYKECRKDNMDDYAQLICNFTDVHPQRDFEQQLKQHKKLTYSIMFTIVILLNLSFIFLPNITVTLLSYPFRYLGQIIAYHFTTSGAIARIILLGITDGISLYMIPHEFRHFNHMQAKYINYFVQK